MCFSGLPGLGIGRARNTCIDDSMHVSCFMWCTVPRQPIDQPSNYQLSTVSFFRGSSEEIFQPSASSDQLSGGR